MLAKPDKDELTVLIRLQSSEDFAVFLGWLKRSREEILASFPDVDNEKFLTKMQGCVKCISVIESEVEKADGSWRR